MLCKSNSSFSIKQQAPVSSLHYSINYFSISYILAVNQLVCEELRREGYNKTASKYIGTYNCKCIATRSAHPNHCLPSEIFQQVIVPPYAYLKRNRIYTNIFLTTVRNIKRLCHYSKVLITQKRRTQIVSDLQATTLNQTKLIADLASSLFQEEQNHFSMCLAFNVVSQRKSFVFGKMRL